MVAGLETKLYYRGVKELFNQIKYIEALVYLEEDEKYLDFLKTKFKETVNNISQMCIPDSGMKDIYISNNKIHTLENGFILYNDTCVDTDTEGYDGSFSIALAFEYGTGIVGQQNPKLGAWQYNVNNHLEGWWYPTNYDDPNPYKWVDSEGNIRAFTRGIEGYEIYRYTQVYIEKHLYEWTQEYILFKAQKKVGD